MPDYMPPSIRMAVIMRDVVTVGRVRPRSTSLAMLTMKNELYGFQEKEKTNSSYKHNKVLHGILNLTFRMLQHTSSEVTVTKYDKI